MPRKVAEPSNPNQDIIAKMLAICNDEGWNWFLSVNRPPLNGKKYLELVGFPKPEDLRTAILTVINPPPEFAPPIYTKKHLLKYGRPWECFYRFPKLADLARFNHLQMPEGMTLDKPA